MMLRHWFRGTTALLCLLAACGGGDDDGATPPDAAAGADAEADVDAPTIDAPPPMVTVRVDAPTGPFAGAIVLVLDASDQVATSATTDATGLVTAILPPGGKVIAAQSTAAGVGFLWLAPEAGDVLRVLVAPDALPPERTASIVVPAATGTANYHVESPCGSGVSSTTTITYTYRELPGCTTHDLRVFRVSTGNVTSAFYVPDLIVPVGGTVDLQGRTYAPQVNRTVAVTGLPGGLAEAEVRGQLVQGGHGVGASFGDRDPPTNGMVAQAALVDDIDAALLAVTSSFYDNSAEITLSQVGGQNAGTIDASATRVHDVTGATYADSTDALTWTETTTGLAPQGAYVRLEYGSPQALFGGNGLVWNVIAPAGSSLQMPAIPAALPNHAVVNRASTRQTVVLFRHSSGAAFVREHAFGIRTVPDLLPDVGTLVQSSRTFSGI